MFEADYQLGSNRWHVVRLAPGTSTECVCLSDRFFSLTTHWSGRTVVCAGEQCSLCELLPSRGLFYLAVHSLGAVRLLELGAQSASHLEQHCKLLHAGIRPGHVLSLSRRTARSPVYSEVLRTDEGVKCVPLLTLAMRVMCIYKYPPANPCEGLEEYEQRCIRMASVRNDLLAASIKRGEQNEGTKSRSGSRERF